MSKTRGHDLSRFPGHKEYKASNAKRKAARTRWADGCDDGTAPDVRWFDAVQDDGYQA